MATPIYKGQPTTPTGQTDSRGNPIYKDAAGNLLTQQGTSLVLSHPATPAAPTNPAASTPSSYYDTLAKPDDPPIKKFNYIVMDLLKSYQGVSADQQAAAAGGARHLQDLQDNAVLAPTPADETILSPAAQASVRNARANVTSGQAQEYASAIDKEDARLQALHDSFTQYTSLAKDLFGQELNAPPKSVVTATQNLIYAGKLKLSDIPADQRQYYLETLDPNRIPLDEEEQLKLDLIRAQIGSANRANRSGSSVNGPIDPSKLSARAKAVLANPALLNNYTATEKGKIQDELAAAGVDLSNLSLPTVNATQRDNITNFDTLLREATNAADLLNSGLKTGPGTTQLQQLQATFGGAKDFTSYNSSISNLNSILLRLRSGAAVTPQEYERIKGFIPTVNDNQATAQNKLQNFYNEITQNQQDYLIRSTQTSAQIKNSAAASAAVPHVGDTFQGATVVGVKQLK